MNEYRTSLVLFAIALAIVVSVASVTTINRIDTRRASNDAPAGTTGLAKPHGPLDRAPGVPITKDR